MDFKEFQYYKEKYNLPTVIDQDEIEGKIIDKYIDDDTFGILLFTDNTCITIHSNDYSEVVIDNEWHMPKEDFLLALKDEFPDCHKEYQENKKSKFNDEEKKRRYEQYLKLKKEFD